LLNSRSVFFPYPKAVSSHTYLRFDFYSTSRREFGKNYRNWIGEGLLVAGFLKAGVLGEGPVKFGCGVVDWGAEYGFGLNAGE
jgi:hypothetical protein